MTVRAEELKFQGEPRSFFQRRINQLHVGSSDRPRLQAPGAGDGTAQHTLSAPALALVLVASFMVVLDFSIVNVALPSIHTVLHFGGDSVQWVVTSYAITFSGLLILGGRVADLFGRRRSFIVGLLVFSWASLAAGLSGDAATLIISRAVQGIGAAIVAPAALSLITSRIKEGSRRTRALGLYGAIASIGFVAGQVLGGVFVQYMGWASIFLINVPVGIIAAVLAFRLISNDGQRGNLAHLDVAGAGFATLGVAAIVFAVSEGTVTGWGAIMVIAAFIVTAISAVAFVLVERVHPHPLVRLRLLTRPNLSSAAILTLLLGAWTAGELVVLSMYLQQSLHDSPLVAGLVIAPQGAMGFLTGMYGSRLIRVLGMRRLLMASTLSTGVGFLALTALPSSGHYGVALLAVILVGFGTVGTVFGSTVMATAGMADSDQGLVGGVINTTRQVGAALGVAVLVAIAEGAHASTGTSTLRGDRLAMLVAALFGLSGILVAWFGTRAHTTLSPAASAASRNNSDSRQGGEHEIHHIG